MTRLLGGSPVPAVRRVRAALFALGLALAVFDGLLLSGRVAPWSQAQAGAPGCGAPRTALAAPSFRRPAAVAAAPAGLLWLPVGGARPTALLAGAAPRLDHPAVSPDGRRIAFLAGGDGIVAGLLICDLRDHATRTLSLRVPAGNFPLSWDKHGKRLVFLGGDLLGWGADQRPFVVEPSGAGLRQLAGDSPWYYDGVSVSPDGTKLALLLQWKYPQGREPEQLSVLDLRTGRLARVAGSSQVAEIDAVSWSPDGTRLVFSAYGANPHGGLYAVDLATHRLAALLVRGAGASDPAWSPDGRSIAFVRGGPRSSSIWLLDVRSGSTRRLTWGGVDVAPTWTPNGKALVFVRRAPAA